MSFVIPPLQLLILLSRRRLFLQALMRYYFLSVISADSLVAFTPDDAGRDVLMTSDPFVSAV